jgi:hypothetical protein
VEVDEPDATEIVVDEFEGAETEGVSHKDP